MSDHVLTERRWRGWLEWTGYREEEASLEWCREQYESRTSRDGQSLRDYISAWQDGYGAALSDIRKGLHLP